MLFFQNQHIETFFQEYHQSVKQYGSRSGPTFCQYNTISNRQIKERGGGGGREEVKYKDINIQQQNIKASFLCIHARLRHIGCSIDIKDNPMGHVSQSSVVLFEQQQARAFWGSRKIQKGIHHVETTSSLLLVGFCEGRKGDKLDDVIGSSFRTGMA